MCILNTSGSDVKRLVMNRHVDRVLIDWLIEEKAARSFSYSGKNVVMLCGIKGLPENIFKLLKSENEDRQPDLSRQDARNHPDHTSSPLNSKEMLLKLGIDS